MAPLDTATRSVTHDSAPFVQLGPARRLASASEVHAALRATLPRDLVPCDIRTWPQVQVISLKCPEAGSLTVGPVAFYGLVTFNGAAPTVDVRDGRGGCVRRVASGATPVVGPGRGMTYSWTQAHDLSIVCLEPSLVRRVAADSGLGDCRRPDVPDCLDDHDRVSERLVDVLADEARVDGYSAQLLIVESVAAALAGRLLRPSPAELRGFSEPGALGPVAFARVRAYIDGHLGEGIALADLANLVGISRFHFARRFRLRTGESPMGYLLRTRIERAKTRLVDPETKVSDIASSLGFADQSHFTRTFRRLVGVSPSAFRTARAQAWNASAVLQTPQRAAQVEVAG